MTELLGKAFAEASKLSEREQDALAEWLMEELASDQRWTEAFADAEDALARIADEALTEHREGRTSPMAPDELRSPIRRNASAGHFASCRIKSSARQLPIRVQQIPTTWFVWSMMASPIRPCRR